MKTENEALKFDGGGLIEGMTRIIMGGEQGDRYNEWLDRECQL